MTCAAVKTQRQRERQGGCGREQAEDEVADAMHSADHGGPHDHDGCVASLNRVLAAIQQWPFAV
jgi:hypothetical protein